MSYFKLEIFIILLAKSVWWKESFVFEVHRYLFHYNKFGVETNPLKPLKRFDDKKQLDLIQNNLLRYLYHNNSKAETNPLK